MAREGLQAKCPTQGQRASATVEVKRDSYTNFGARRVNRSRPSSRGRVAVAIRGSKDGTGSFKVLKAVTSPLKEGVISIHPRVIISAVILR